MDINFAKIEKKWQDRWASEKIFEVNDSAPNPYYVLEMFPYPSGTGLHMGHAWNYTIGDILARFKRMNGFNVMHPMGFDSLGLPAEDAAIKAGKHPDDYTNTSIPNFVRQMKEIGLSYDWSRTFSSHEPSYYKWDQWIFLKMLEKGLAYQKEASVNWCSECNTVLANEQVHEGKCWRHENVEVESRKLRQWFFKTTEYAQELLDGLDGLDWPDRTKAMQRNWIGRSEGTEISFEISRDLGDLGNWKVFTTRPDTIFGVTFMVVAAGHSRLDELVTAEQRKDVDKFLKKVHSVSEKDVSKLDKEGVFTGSYAVNPANGEKIPIWVGNFVLADYGSGMVMAVPAHDQRDFEFAKKYGIDVRVVVEPETGDRGDDEESRKSIVALVRNPKDGKILTIDWGDELGGNLLIGGGLNDGEDIVECAKREIKEETGYSNVKFIGDTETHHHHYFAHSKNKARCIDVVGLYFELINEKKVDQKLEDNEKGKFAVKWSEARKLENEIRDPLHRLIFDRFVNGKIYTGEGLLVNSGEFDGLGNIEAKKKITNWLIKQNVGKRVVNFKLRDWGVSRQRYWGTPIPIIYCEKCGAVPVSEKDLPVVLPKDVKFGEGNPLETNDEWLSAECPKCGGKGRRESDTMDTFVNSSWYFLRYCDSKNDKEIFGSRKVKYWCPVDTYIGGAEHACMHLIYSRFYVKFLRDLGLIDFSEPAKRLFHQGMLLAEGGVKMSKSKPETVVLPEDVSYKYGIDTARFFLSSLASPDKDIDWSEKGISGSSRFVSKIFEFFEEFKSGTESDELLSKLNKTIENVGGYYDNFEYRKATIELRELFDLVKEGCSGETAGKFLQLLSPICPHITEELWEKLGNKGFISKSEWPKTDEKKILKKGKNGNLNGKIIERILSIIKDDTKKVYVYVMPFEIDKVDVKKINKGVGKVVEVYSVSDKDKKDPKGMAKKAKPGMVSIYLE